MFHKLLSLVHSLCVLGNRLMKIDIDAIPCNKSNLRSAYCPANGPDSACDPYFLKENLTVLKGIRGLTSGVLKG